MNQAAGSCSVSYCVSSELLSFRAPQRRLSFGTATTGVPEEDDRLSEFDEEDIHVGDHLEGDGGISQAICTSAQFIEKSSVSTCAECRLFFNFIYGCSLAFHVCNLDVAVICSDVILA